MGYGTTTSKPSKAMRLARRLVNSYLDWADIGGHIGDALKYPEEYNQLFMAVDADYLKNENRLNFIGHEIKNFSEEVQALFIEYSDLHVDQLGTRELVWFQLGYAAALRLLGSPPPMELIPGGNRTPKLKSAANL